VPNLTLNPNGDKASLLLLSDPHIGHECFNRPLFEKYLELADDLNAYFTLGGDLWEVAIPSRIEESVFEIEFSTGDQYKESLRYLLPFRDKILFSITGNHDARVWKKTGFDMAEHFAREMGCFYNNHGGYLIVNVGSQTYKLAIFHGYSVTVNPFTELEKRYGVYDDADVIVMGNNHHLAHKAIVKKRVIDGDEKRYIVHLIRSGGFITEPDYSRVALYNPTLDGAALIHFGAKNRKIEVDVFGETKW
jgi:predicted phosphodiesterase